MDALQTPSRARPAFTLEVSTSGSSEDDSETSDKDDDDRDEENDDAATAAAAAEDDDAGVRSATETLCAVNLSPPHERSTIIQTPSGKAMCYEVEDSSDSEGEPLPPNPPPPSSPFRGVSWHRPTSSWQANIKVAGRLRHLGRFDNENAAAKRYDEEAAKFAGRPLNFPPNGAAVPPTESAFSRRRRRRSVVEVASSDDEENDNDDSKGAAAADVVDVDVDVDDDHDHDHDHDLQRANDLEAPKGHQFCLPTALWRRLYPHQKVGVRWLRDRYTERRGALLGDEMGLGKTVQTCSLLAGMFHGGCARLALVVAPLSCLAAWEAELRRTFHDISDGLACPGGGERHIEATRLCRIEVLSSAMGQQRRQQILDSLERPRSRNSGARGGLQAAPCAVVVCTYGLLSSIKDSDDVRRRLAPPSLGFYDVLVLDEGHKIKNKNSRTSRHVKLIPARWRLLLTGTPVQNNLEELWALFDFLSVDNDYDDAAANDDDDDDDVICVGEGRGSWPDWPTFRSRFAEPIERALLADADDGARRTGRRRAAQLKRLVVGSILQRSKKQVQAFTERLRKKQQQQRCGNPAGEDGGGDGATTSAGAAASAMIHSCPSLPPKHELVLWIGLSHTQRCAYQQFLDGSDLVNEVMLESSGAATGGKCRRFGGIGPLAAIAHLKKLTGHCLLASSASSSTSADHVETIDWGNTRAAPHVRGSNGSASGSAGLVVDIAQSAEDLLCGSQKLATLVALVEDLCNRRGHSVLVFSQSVRMLHIIERCLDVGEGLISSDLGVLRLDGSVGGSERARRVEAFNESNKADADDVMIRHRVMLLTTGAGGLGLTLTGADRVIMYDPAWNPAEDAQAVDRAHRFGQTRPVICYRFVGAGTVEEKIYEKQVFKDGLRRTLNTSSTPARRRGGGSDLDSDNEDEEEVDFLQSSAGVQGSGEAHRYFTRDELRSLFVLGKAGECSTMDQLHAAHGTALEWAGRVRAESTALGIDGKDAEVGAAALSEELEALQQGTLLDLVQGISPQDALYTSHRVTPAAPASPVGHPSVVSLLESPDEEFDEGGRAEGGESDTTLIDKDDETDADADEEWVGCEYDEESDTGTLIDEDFDDQDGKVDVIYVGSDSENESRGGIESPEIVPRDLNTSSSAIFDDLVDTDDEATDLIPEEREGSDTLDSEAISSTLRLAKTSPLDLSVELRQRWNSLVSDSHRLEQEGCQEDALKKLFDALELADLDEGLHRSVVRLSSSLDLFGY